MSRQRRAGGYDVSAFARRGVGDRIARWLVLEMVLWPGLLFIGGSLLVAWRLREQPVALAAWAVATAFSVTVGVRQWGVMLRAVFLSRSDVSSSPTGEDSPRPPGRGGTGASEEG